MLREGVLGGILRFMGVNSKQMGVIALNCLIILAEWVIIRNNNVIFQIYIATCNLVNILVLYLPALDNIINDREQRSCRSDRSHG